MKMRTASSGTSPRRRSPSVYSAMDATEHRTPQVRGRDGASENGSGVSPKATRPAIMVQPDVIPTAETTMTLQELTAIVKNLDARAEARLTWTKCIAEAVEEISKERKKLSIF